MPSVHSDITCEATVGAKLTDTSEGIGLSALFHLQAALALTQGVGANQINAIAVERDRTMTGPASYELDLATLAGFEQPKDPLRNTVVFDNIVALLIRCQASSDGDLIIGGASTNPWTAPFAASGAPTTVKITLKPGGFILLTAPTSTGYPVAGTNKILRFETTTGHTKTDIIVFGRDNP
jgi:hypothetical protein